MDDRENSMPALMIDEEAPASASRSPSTDMEEWYSRLAVHMKKKVECEVCGKMYASKKSLKIHNRIHTGFKPYQCTMCGKRFTQCNVLHAHLNAHTGTRNWKCTICNKAFTQSAHLRTHEKTHFGSKDYRCDHCGRCFSSKGVRDRHERQHTGEKPYKCGRCNKSFTRGESLKFHENAHDGIRPYTCRYNLCLSSFTKKSSLKRHIDTCHRRLRRPHSESVSIKSDETGTTLEDSGPEDSNDVEAADELVHIAIQRVFELPLEEVERILTKGANNAADREVLENELELARWDMLDSPSEASFDSGYFTPAGTPSPTFSHSSSMPTMSGNGFDWPISEAGLGFLFPKLESFEHELQVGNRVENLAISILNSAAPPGSSGLDAMQPCVQISRPSLTGPMPIRIKEEPIDSINPFWLTDSSSSARQDSITPQHNPVPPSFHSERAFRQAMLSSQQLSVSAANMTGYPTMYPSSVSFANYAPKPSHSANQPPTTPRNGFYGLNGFHGGSWMETNERKPRMF